LRLIGESHILQAVPSFVLPRFLEDARERAEHARKLAEIVREAGPEANVTEERKRFYADPADSLTLRGLPALGRGVTGVIRGTQPEQHLLAGLPDE